MIATLVYHLDVGLQNAADATLLARASDINFNQGSFDWLGVDVAGDATVTESEHVIKRTIMLETTPFGNSLWRSPTQLKYATRNLLSDIFALKMPARVTADEPVIS